QAKPRALLSCICMRGLPLSLHSTVLCTTIRETARSARCPLRTNACRREVTREIGTTVYHVVPILFALTYANKCVRPTGQAIALDSKRNPERRLVPGCIFTVHSDSAHNKRYKLIGWIARDVSPRLSGLAQRLEATYIPNVRRTDARFMTITRTKRGWPLSRSSLCILAVPSFSIGNLFRTYNPHN
ncbi:hypothetical protein ALC60_07878, partial [Trachymyrmex zeteki]